MTSYSAGIAASLATRLFDAFVRIAFGDVTFEERTPDMQGGVSATAGNSSWYRPDQLLP